MKIFVDPSFPEHRIPDIVSTAREGFKIKGANLIILEDDTRVVLPASEIDTSKMKQY